MARQSPLSKEFSRQEYWSDLHFLFWGIIPIQGSNLPLLHWQVCVCVCVCVYVCVCTTSHLGSPPTWPQASKITPGLPFPSSAQTPHGWGTHTYLLKAEKKHTHGSGLVLAPCPKQHF